MDISEQQGQNSQSNATPYEEYVSGAKDPYGKVIKYVIGRHRQFVVYITEEDAVAWNYDRLPEHLRPAIAHFQHLIGIARSTLGRKQLHKVAVLLGPALYAALLSGESEGFTRHFEGARSFIYSKATQTARLAYVLLSMLFGGIIVGIALLLCRYAGASENFRQALLVGITGGVTGSVVSIIQRARNLEIDPLDSAILVGFHGLSRVGLGAIFGILLVVASKANIALGHFAGDLWALFGLSAGAGFTERWIPELLGRHVE